MIWVIDLDCDPTAHQPVSLIQDELLDVVVREDPAAVHGKMLGYLAGLVCVPSALYPIDRLP